MRTNRQSLISQRKLIERKIRPWLAARTDQMPRSGWIKAVRGALGMTTRQLAERVGVGQSSITRLEEREPEGKVTLERLAKTARAMNCTFIYAIVPDERFASLEAIIDERAQVLAERLVRSAEHSMRLEKQGSSNDDLPKDVDSLAHQLKSKMDARIWGKRAGSSRPEAHT